MSDIFQIEIQHTRDVDTAGRAAICQLCAEAHADDEFYKLFEVYLPPHSLHFTGRLNGQAVSHAVVTTRWMQPEGCPLLRTAYVDAVATHPSQRGKGFGAAVMRKLGETIAAEWEIGGLQTDLRGFYEPLGWELWRGALAGRGDDGLIPTPEQEGVMILRLPRTPPLNLDGLLTIGVSGRIW